MGTLQTAQEGAVRIIGRAQVRDHAPGSAVDPGLDPPASALRVERAAAGGVLHTRRGRHLSPSPASDAHHPAHREASTLPAPGHKALAPSTPRALTAPAHPLGPPA